MLRKFYIILQGKDNLEEARREMHGIDKKAAPHTVFWEKSDEHRIWRAKITGEDNESLIEIQEKLKSWGWVHNPQIPQRDP